jgi:2,4-didehydro-3-deoxy-L-rhamnonate hydrolase
MSSHSPEAASEELFMRICRFNGDRLGLIDGIEILDVSEVVERLPAVRWPIPWGDPLISRLHDLREPLAAAAVHASRLPVASVRLDSPVTNPSKIMAAPANYRKHIELDTLDPGVDQGTHRDAMINLERPVDTYGLFLKASSCLVGPAQGITIDWPGEARRVDHEVEIAIVIGRTARHIKKENALEYVAGYGIGLDITIRGNEDRSFRKSADSFAVLGPWLATPDEIDDPTDLKFWLSVNGEMRQSSSTRAITVGLAELIEIASSVYALYPGDILLSGTPEGVGPLRSGDVIVAGAAGIGEMTVHVRARRPV